MPRVIVIGGGVSGLSLAYYLLQEVPETDVLLVESEKHLGGTLWSETVDGFVFEHGANGFLDDEPYTLDLARALGLQERLRPAARPASQSRYILKRQKLHPVPMTPGALLRSPLLSLRSKLCLFMEPFQPKAREGEEDSVASFGRRRLGEEAMRTFLDPLATSIYAGDVERLSMASAFPKITELESRYGSLVRGMMRKRKEKGRRLARGTLYSFAKGMGELVEALENHLGERVRPEWKASSVQKQDRGFVVKGSDGAGEEVDVVALALPSYSSASLFASSDSETAHAFESIPYAPIAVVCLGFPRQSVRFPLNGYGFLIPRDQGRRLLGAIWISSIYPEHAPEEKVSLRCFIGGARDPDIINSSDQAILETVLGDLRPILDVNGDPSPVRIFRYGRGIPQYNLDHRRRIERLERRLWNLPGVYILGNAYYGVGINDCVREGKKKAEAIREYLRQ